MNPLHLLSLEWKKFSPNGTFRVIAALYAGSFALVLYFAHLLGHNMTVNMNGTVTHPLAGVFEGPRSYEIMALIGSWMNMFLLGYLGVFEMTVELGNRTLRQNIIFGMSRLEAAVSKLVWAVAQALAVTLFFVVLALAAQLMIGGGLGWPPIDCVLRYFLQALGYLFLGTLVGFLIRQAAAATLVYLAYVLFLETVCRWVIYFTVAKSRALLFLPHHVLDALTPLPVPETVNHIVQSSTNISMTSLSPTEAMVAALVYATLFAALFCRRIVKSDL